MPAGGVDSEGFDLNRVDYLSPVVDGRQGSVTAGFPLWRMSLTFANATADETDEWRAWADGQRGSQRLFFGRDLSRPYPKAHVGGFGGMNRAAGGGFDGSATSWSVNADRDVLALTGLPAGLKLGHRDYVGFRWLTGGEARRALVRVIEPAVATGAGVLSDLTVEPALPGVVPGSAVAYLNEPDCLMRLVSGETQFGQIDTLHSGGGSLTGLQELLP